MQINIEEVAALLGHKDIEIMLLKKQIIELQQQLAALQKPSEQT